MANKANETIKNEFMNMVKELFETADYDVLQVKSGTFSIPMVTSDGEEGFVNIALSVPKGERGGNGYDGYEMAEDYKFHLEQKELKKKETARKKAEKIARDKKLREEKKALKEASKEKAVAEIEAMKEKLADESAGE